MPLKTDHRICTPQQNFGASFFGNRVPKKNVVRAKAFYERAYHFCKDKDFRNVIDLNCTSEEDFRSHGWSKEVNLISETHDTLSYWSFKQLSKYFSGFLHSSKPHLFIAKDLLSTIDDPRWILSQIRFALLSCPQSRCLFSFSCQSKEYVTRQWTLREFTHFISSAGFIVEAEEGDGYDFDVIISCNPDYYQNFLVNENICSVSALPTRLVVVTEHPSIGKTGGIGTYCHDLEKLVHQENIQICFISVERKQMHFGLSHWGLFKDENIYTDNAAASLDIVQQALFFLPSVDVIEYQDYQGIGARIVQAKASGLLPFQIQLEVGCHGSSLYIESANQAWFGTEQNEQIMLEKIAIEGADTIRFPTVFLKDFYQASGYSIQKEKIVIERYPFEPYRCHLESIQQFSRIVFLGKQNRMKGFPEFLEVIYELFEENALPGLREIVCFGPVLEISPLDNHRKEYLKKKLLWREVFLDRHEIQDELSNLACDSLGFIPYRQDNHPYAVLEILASGMPFVAFATGGIPELIPEQFHNDFVCQPSPTDAKSALKRKWNKSLTERQKNSHELLESFIKKQHSINKRIIERYSQKPIATKEESFAVQKQLTLSLVIPVYNTELTFISELIFSIEQQRVLPDQIIFIDDASDEEYSKQLALFLRKQLALDYQLIRNNKNLGLSGARNRGVEAVTSDIVVTIDSDDVIATDFLSVIKQGFLTNPNTGAVVTYLELFDEGTEWQNEDVTRSIYEPLGEGLIASQIENRYGHANSGFRTDILRKIGGWNQTSRAMWEDWELYERIVSRDIKITIVPKCFVFYRVRPNSMARTYAQFPATLRVASGFERLPRFEAMRLQAAMRQNQRLLTMKEEYEQLKEEYKDLLARNNNLLKQYNRFMIRMTRKIIHMIEFLKVDYIFRLFKR